ARLVALGLAQAMLAALAALGVRWLFDAQALAAFGTAELTAAIGATGVAVALLQVMLLTAIGRDAEALGQQYVAAVRLALLAHLFALAPRDHQRLRRGHLMARLSGDLGALSRWVGRCLAPLVAGCGVLLLACVVLLRVSPVLATVYVAGGVLAVAAGWAVSARLELALRHERRQRWALMGHVGEKIAEAAVVQAHGQGARELRRLASRQTRLLEATVQRARWAALLRSLPVGTATLLLGLTAAWGAWQVGAGHWTMGTLAGLLTLLGLALAPLRDMALALGGWRAWRVSCEKLGSFLRQPAMRRSGRTETLRAPDGRLELHAVTVPGALARVSFDVAPGTSVALHGPSCSGKSVLLAVCAGLVEPSEGDVTLDGQSLAECSLESLAARVALLSTDLPLLRGTIASNLRYRCRSATPAQMQEALARVGLRDAVAAMPMGLNTAVREGGRNLPTTIRHRLCLARALMNAPALLLIDDFDALLFGDDDGDAPLRRLLAEGRHTVVLVTHDPCWQRRCSTSIGLRQGAVVASPRLAVAREPVTGGAT
ncbi:MAG: ABC transporter ATP-binding protein, partial [Rubrivivax sp.]|nr:ABC transporter ATP-binding protein [Rubrivivax sp.]